MNIINIQSHSRVGFIDITGEVEKIIKRDGEVFSAVMLYVPHTTAGLTISVRQGGDTVETGPVNGDSDVVRDQIAWLMARVGYRGVRDDNGSIAHFKHYELNSDAHVMAMLTGNSVIVPIGDDGKLKLGKWQSIFFCEFDGQRRREVWVRFLL